MKKNICMFVRNNCKNDSRVLKEAQSLCENGYNVKIIAIFDKNCTEEDVYENRNGVIIERVKLRSLVIFLLTLFRNFNLPSIDLTDKKNSISISTNKKSPKVILLGLLYLLLKPLQILMRFIKRLAKYSKKAVYSILKKLMLPFHRPFLEFDYYKKASKIAIEDKADIAHCHDLNTLWAGYLVKKKLEETKLIYDSHELYLYRNKSSDLAFFSLFEKVSEKFLIKKCDKVITVCDSIADFLRDLYQINRPEVIMNCPIPNNEQIGKEQELAYDIFNDPRKKVLYLGARTFNRGIENVIEAIKYTDENIIFIFMGPAKPEYDHKYKKIAEDNNVENRVYLLDPVPHDQVVLYSQKADLGISPIMNACLSYYYCLPNKLFEYVNSGLPVLVSNFPEMEKVVLGNEIGNSFDPTDPVDIARSINETLEEKNYNRYKRNCEKLNGVFTWEVEENKLINLYSETVLKGVSLS